MFPLGIPLTPLNILIILMFTKIFYIFLLIFIFLIYCLYYYSFFLFLIILVSISALFYIFLKYEDWFIQSYHNPTYYNNYKKSKIKSIKITELNLCSICLEDNTNEAYFICNNKHYFHKDCLSEWTKNKNNCPLCRQNFD